MTNKCYFPYFTDIQNVNLRYLQKKNSGGGHDTILWQYGTIPI